MRPPFCNRRHWSNVGTVRRPFSAVVAAGDESRHHRRIPIPEYREVCFRLCGAKFLLV